MRAHYWRRCFSDGQDVASGRQYRQYNAMKGQSQRQPSGIAKRDLHHVHLVCNAFARTKQSGLFGECLATLSLSSTASFSNCCRRPQRPTTEDRLLAILCARPPCSVSPSKFRTRSSRSLLQTATPRSPFYSHLIFCTWLHVVRRLASLCQALRTVTGPWHAENTVSVCLQDHESKLF